MCVVVVRMEGLRVVDVVRMVVTMVVLGGGLGGVMLVSVCMLRVGVDHFVDHLASVCLLRVECKHRFIKCVDCPALVDVKEGGEVVKGSRRR